MFVVKIKTLQTPDYNQTAIAFKLIKGVLN